MIAVTKILAGRGRDWVFQIPLASDYTPPPSSFSRIISPTNHRLVLAYFCCAVDHIYSYLPPVRSNEVWSKCSHDRFFGYTFYFQILKESVVHPDLSGTLSSSTLMVLYTNGYAVLLWRVPEIGCGSIGIAVGMDIKEIIVALLP